MNLFTSQRSSPTHDIPESRQEQGYGAISPSRVESPARGNSLDYEVFIENFYELTPHTSVYSLQMFMLPRAFTQTKRWINLTWAYVFSLTVLNFIIQGFLTACVATHITVQRSEFLSSILDAQPQGCRDPASLCTKLPSGKLTCSAPGLRLLGNWSMLDLNSDGVWSLAEAQNEGYRADLRCRFGLDLLALYDQIHDGIAAAPELEPSLGKDFKDRQSIPRILYEYYKAKPMLCAYGDADSCGNLFQAGLFDSAIRFGDADGHGISDFQSALDWCRSVLASCEDTLDNTFRVFSMQKEKSCGKKQFYDITYDSPDSREGKYMLGVDFESRVKYHGALGLKFSCFLGMLIFAFLASMYEEWKSMYRYFLFAVQFPQREGVNETFLHRLSVGLFTTLRCVLFICILTTGVAFMTSSVKYLDLIFNALSLVFILQVDELLYQTLVREPMKREHEDCCGSILLRRRQLPIKPVMLLELLTLWGVVATVIVIVAHYQVTILHPVSEALTCSCLVQGKNCLEAELYGLDFWREYWEVTAPRVLAALASGPK